MWLWRLQVTQATQGCAEASSGQALDKGPLVLVLECLTSREEKHNTNAVLPDKYQIGCCSQNHWQCYIPTGLRGHASPEDEDCR